MAAVRYLRGAKRTPAFPATPEIVMCLKKKENVLELFGHSIQFPDRHTDVTRGDFEHMVAAFREFLGTLTTAEFRGSKDHARVRRPRVVFPQGIYSRAGDLIVGVAKLDKEVAKALQPPLPAILGVHWHESEYQTAKHVTAQGGADRRGSEAGPAFNTPDFGARPDDPGRDQDTPPIDPRKNADQLLDMTEIGKELEKIASKREVADVDLGQLQRKPAVETHVKVARGKYGEVHEKIICGPRGGYVITGPTGCGKSTVALLPLFADGSVVMIVEPTQANAANVFHEFAHILPSLFRRRRIYDTVPAVQFVAPTVTQTMAPLRVTTTDKLLEYFYHYGKLPQVDYMVLDEFHLPVPSMVECVELLRTFALTEKYILVSATAAGFEVVPALPKGVTTVTANLPLGRIPPNLEGSDLDPRRWAQRGDGTVAVVAPNISMAQDLVAAYRAWKLPVHLITRHTVMTEYLKAASSYRPGSVFVLEPGVEAGVTLSMSVLVSMGATTAIRYDGRVVVEDTQALDRIAAIQRGGRAGRVRPTLYLSPPPPDHAPPASSADYYRAQAVIKMVAMGADVRKIGGRSVFDNFPRLTTLQRALARSAVAHGGDPFIAVYQHNDEGHVYKECGGEGTGFERLAARELFVYTYPGGFFVSPIADFSDLGSTPDSFVSRDSQLSAARAIVDAVDGLRAKFTLLRLVELVIGKFHVYSVDLMDCLKRVFPAAKPEKYTTGGKPADVEDFIAGDEALVMLFRYLATEPRGVKHVKVVEGEFALHSFVLDSKSVHFAVPRHLMKAHEVDVPKLAAAVLHELGGLLSVEMLISGAPDKCVDLEAYAGRISARHAGFSRMMSGRGPGL